MSEENVIPCRGCYSREKWLDKIFSLRFELWDMLGIMWVQFDIAYILLIHRNRRGRCFFYFSLFHLNNFSGQWGCIHGFFIPPEAKGKSCTYGPCRRSETGRIDTIIFLNNMPMAAEDKTWASKKWLKTA